MHERDLGGILDEALLLVTELTTNSVVHAGTEVDVEITAADTSLTVTVLDFLPGTVVPNIPAPGASTANLDERGRGLLLVDQLASSWGTLHFGGGKGVWFRLDKAGVRSEPAPPTFEVPLAPAPEALGALGWSGTGTSLTEVAEELLQRLVGVIGAAGAALTLDEGDGPHTIAAVGRLTGSVDSGRRVPLRITKPWRAELLVAGGGGNPYARPLTSLAADRLMLLVENHRLRRADSERRTWLTFLADASELLAQSLDVELTLALIPRLVVPRLGTWCAIHAADGGGELRLAAAAHADESMLTELLDALGQAAPQLKEAMSTDVVVPLGPPLEGYVVALVARGQHLGTLAVGGGRDTWQRSEEVAVVEDVARRAALAIDNANIHAERRSVAQALQRSLLPPPLPKVDGVEFGAEYVPTGEGVEVGGDFYDVVPLSDRRWLVVVGDVSGKGVQAATVTGLVRDVTRVLVRDGRPLPETLERINETLVERGAGRFCTLCLAAIMRRARRHPRTWRCTWPGTTSRCCCAPTAAPRWRASAAPRSGCSTRSAPALADHVAPGRHAGLLHRRRDRAPPRRELFGVDRLRREAGLLAGFPADVVVARLRATTLELLAGVPPRRHRDLRGPQRRLTPFPHDPEDHEKPRSRTRTRSTGQRRRRTRRADAGRAGAD